METKANKDGTRRRDRHPAGNPGESDGKARNFRREALADGAVDRGMAHSRLVLLFVILSVVTAALIFALVAPFVLWSAMPYKNLTVWVVDKTVPYPDFREHTGLFWIMKNEKIAKPGTKKLYDERSDYFGFYPYSKDVWRKLALPRTGPRPDVIYLADTYGVYKDDFMQRSLAGSISPIIYGGLSADDNEAISRNLGGGNTLIAEFNTAASPTNTEDRKTLGRLLGVQWAGWIGKYFVDLSRDKEIPSWIVANYERQSGEKWEFFGRGFILISDDDRIEVLSDGDYVGTEALNIRFRQQWAKATDCDKPVPYHYWFEWIKPDPGVSVVADYTFSLTGRGAKKLADLGLPQQFPAVMTCQNTQYTGWYFAGDFADLKLPATTYKAKWISWLKKALVDNSVDDNNYFYWNAYVPLMQLIFADSLKSKVAVTAQTKAEPAISVRAFGKGFQMRDKEGLWKDFFVRGVNMGIAKPGKFFTEFPENVDDYLRWLDEIADMHANTVRVYTLPPPEFYRALSVHNTQKPEKALYLLQEIWPEENPPNGDYLAEKYRKEYLQEIDYGVDAVYGRANIPERKGRAWGVYTSDVSPWLLGWLVGRELESGEVMETDSRNKGAAYAGAYVSAGPDATPTEVWLAESLDEVASIEAKRYGKLHPVAVVSWPTLDPKSHDSEWDPAAGKKNRWNDRTSIDIGHLDISGKMAAGIFGAYHIYPNYPDFMNNEVSYARYLDGQGVLRYGGYLKEFIADHRRYPALVAEFGLANGAGVAHFSPDGLNHGGIDEAEAGAGLLRMLGAIEREGYAGGLVFEWMDEWAKKTWTTESYMIPYDRHVLWHNVADPEQNYGLLANETVKPSIPDMVFGGTGLVRQASLSADASYLYIDVELRRPLDSGHEELLIGLDTLDRQLGQTLWPVGKLPAASGLEYVVRISGADKAHKDGKADRAELLVIPSYNVSSARYATTVMHSGVFERITPLVNAAVTTKDGRKIPARRADASTLRQGDFDEAGNLWNMRGNTLALRIPWMLLNVTDPSSGTVLQDPRRNIPVPGRDELRTVKTDGFVVYGIVWNDFLRQESGGIVANPQMPYRWRGWEVPPLTRERLKKSYYILQKAWAAEPDAPATFQSAAPAPSASR